MYLDAMTAFPPAPLCAKPFIPGQLQCECIGKEVTVSSKKAETKAGQLFSS